MASERPLLDRHDERTDADDYREDDLLAELELLAEENRRLREDYARVRSVKHRRTALALAVVGTISIAGGVAFPAQRALLVSLGATGLFGAILTYYLTPERLVAASIGEGIFDAHARNGRRIADALGLQETMVYLPVDGGRPDAGDVRLFVPQRRPYEIPAPEALSSPFVVTEDDRERGLSIRPAGATFLSEFESTLADDVADAPDALAEQLTDTLVEGFELARSARVDVDVRDGHATIALSDVAFGDPTRFDHPVASFVASGLARGLGVPVTTESTTVEARDTDVLVTCRWNPAQTPNEALESP